MTTTERDRREPASDSDDVSDDDSPQGPKRENIPDPVDHFLGKLNDSITEGNVSEIQKLYEDQFNKLSDKHYKSKPWPSAERVADQLNIDLRHNLFIILYKELYYRHVYTKSLASYEDRRGSWENYCQLLDLFIDDLERNQKIEVAIPVQWLWDILDEFIYHFQTYCTFRSKCAQSTAKHNEKRHEADVAKLRENPEVFETTRVLTYLHKLVKESLVEEWLREPHNPQNKAGAFTDEFVRYAGYFALMQLLRMQSMLGDYRLALQTIKHIDFQAEVPLFYKVPASHVTLFYYMGFAYMMQRRYSDAIRTFSDILMYFSKTSPNSLSAQYDFIMKKTDQMYLLLIVCLHLSPQTIEEKLNEEIKDSKKQYQEKQAKLQRNEDLVYEDIFSYACPKFVSPAAPDWDNLEETVKSIEATERQLHVFLREVQQQQALPKIGAYMKLYTSLKTSKLAQLCEMSEEGLRDQLMCVMHKTRQFCHKGEGPPIDGELKACSEVQFYLDGDMVHINTHKPTRPHAEVFLEQILKFQEILKKVDGG